MKPTLVVKVGANRALRDFPGANCRISRHAPKPNQTITVRENDLHSFIFDEPGMRIFVTPLSQDLSVTIKNNTSVPLVLETHMQDGSVLDDVLKQNKERKIAYNSWVRVTV